MTDADRLLSCLRRLEPLKVEWDDKKFDEIETDCLAPLTQTVLNMQETERGIYTFIFAAERALEQIEDGTYY